MAYHHILLVLHLLAATVWVGGHVLLLFLYVPKSLRLHDKQIILNFEKQYEKIGLPSLLILIVTGIAMALNYGIMPWQWFHFDLPVERVVSIKLLLLLITLMLAINAQLRVIPKLKAGHNNLIMLVVHIVLVTTTGILMLLFGSFIRFGGI